MQKAIFLFTFLINSVLIVRAEPPVEYGPQKDQGGGGSDTEYGPPGFTPGNPVGQYSRSGGGGGGGCNNMDINRNKQLVMTFYQDIFEDKNFDNLDKYLSQKYINHNPNVMDGIASLRQALDGPLGKGPRTKIDFQRVSAEGDLVWTHIRIHLPGFMATFAAVDIFRIDCDGLIEEHWDVRQDINVPSRNPHPFF